MKKVTLYTWSYCPFCVRAKKLLEAKGVPYEEISLDGKDEEKQALVEKTGLRTVPQIFIGDELVGGFTDLAEWDQQGKLDEKLKG